nr:glycine-rich cell wall structural protein 1-like [Malus domestica]
MLERRLGTLKIGTCGGGGCWWRVDGGGCEEGEGGMTDEVEGKRRGSGWGEGGFNGSGSSGGVGFEGSGSSGEGDLTGVGRWGGGVGFDGSGSSGKGDLTGMVRWGWEGGGGCYAGFLGGLMGRWVWD